MGFHRLLLERWNCREIDKWESPGGVGSDRGLCTCSPLPLLVFKELVCAGRKPQRSHTKLFAFRQPGTLECTALTKICCKPLCIHADSLEMSLSARLSDEELVYSVSLLVLCSLLVTSQGQVSFAEREKSFILSPDLEDSKFKSMVLETHDSTEPHPMAGKTARAIYVYLVPLFPIKPQGCRHQWDSIPKPLSGHFPKSTPFTEHHS